MGQQTRCDEDERYSEELPETLNRAGKNRSPGLENASAIVELLAACRRRRIVGEMLAQLGGELLHPGAHVLIERLDYRSDSFIRNGLIVRIERAPRF